MGADDGGDVVRPGEGPDTHADGRPSGPRRGEVVLLRGAGELAGELLAGDGHADQDVPGLGAPGLAVPGGQLGEVEVGADRLQQGQTRHLVPAAAPRHAHRPLLQQDGPGLRDGAHLQ